ncbi:unnamed protein product [Prunus armeniaca]|uniref:Uncharacterized protein n=1 Tax=Prunus armeniaca TaxID=36596 RepID=A0A6J5WXF1_PRUAR|nr:unnamed protein product [Prunus armeniaca]CAB4304755.1 unnamed protein product [Prunus armeniaca]
MSVQDLSAGLQKATCPVEQRLATKQCWLVGDAEATTLTMGKEGPLLHPHGRWANGIAKAGLMGAVAAPLSPDLTSEILVTASVSLLHRSHDLSSARTWIKVCCDYNVVAIMDESDSVLAVIDLLLFWWD